MCGTCGGKEKGKAIQPTRAGIKILQQFLCEHIFVSYIIYQEFHRLLKPPLPVFGISQFPLQFLHPLLSFCQLFFYLNWVKGILMILKNSNFNLKWMSSRCKLNILQRCIKTIVLLTEIDSSRSFVSWILTAGFSIAAFCEVLVVLGLGNCIQG